MIISSLSIYKMHWLFPNLAITDPNLFISCDKWFPVITECLSVCQACQEIKGNGNCPRSDHAVLFVQIMMFCIMPGFEGIQVDLHAIRHVSKLSFMFNESLCLQCLALILSTISPPRFSAVKTQKIQIFGCKRWICCMYLSTIRTISESL